MVETQGRAGQGWGRVRVLATIIEKRVLRHILSDFPDFFFSQFNFFQIYSFYFLPDIVSATTTAL